MPTFEIELPGNKRYEVDAPDIATASKQAQAFQVQQHPWNQFNRAAQSGQVAKGGEDYPGAGHVPTAGQAAGEGGLLLGSILAGPAAAAATGSTIVAPAVARAGVAALPGLANGDVSRAGWSAGSSLGLDALMNLIGLGKYGAGRLLQRQPAVHQAANFQQPVTLYGPQGQVVSQTTPPIVFNRVNPSGAAPAVRGGGPTTVTPNTVTVQPPSSGAPITSGSSPAAILQEPVGSTATQAMAETAPALRGLGTYAAGKEPEITSALLLGILNKAKEAGHAINPFGGHGGVGGMVP